MASFLVADTSEDQCNSTLLGAFSQVVFFGRTYEEYLQMFPLLSDDKIAGNTILDCPGGPSAWTSVANNALGMKAVAVDPIYAKPLSEIHAEARLAFQHVQDKLICSPNALHLDFDRAHYLALKQRALESFLEDFVCQSDRYIAASLPTLPFADCQFDLVVSGHLLFVYAPLSTGGVAATGFDYDWHRAAFLELLRVTKRQLLIFPATTFPPDKSGHVYIHQYAEKLVAEFGSMYSMDFYPSDYSQGCLSDEVFGLKVTVSTGEVS